MSESLILYYAHDPMCSFCWAFRPTWSNVKQSLAEQSPDIKIKYLMGGLAPDSDLPMPEDVRTKVINAWRYIEDNIPGIRFNHDFWAQQLPRRSTYPACRAVFAAKLINRHKEDDMILAIQKSYYLNAQNPSNDDTLIQCASTIGLDEENFTAIFKSPACEAGFKKQRALSQRLGITGFPGLVLTKGSSRFSIPIDYNNTLNIMNSIDQVLATPTNS